MKGLMSCLTFKQGVLVNLCIPCNNIYRIIFWIFARPGLDFSRPHSMYQSEAAESWGISPCAPTTLTTPAGAKWVGRQEELVSLMPTVVKVGMFWQPLMQIWAGDVYSQFGMASSGCFFFVPFSWWGRDWNPFHWFPPCICWNGFQVFGMLSFTSALVKYPGWFKSRSLLLKWRLRIVFSDLSWSVPLNMVGFLACSLLSE